MEGKCHQQYESVRAVILSDTIIELQTISRLLQSWEQTYLLWTPLTKFLVQFPKFKGEEVVDMAHRSGAKRRASHQNTEHELDDNLNEWVNMTGFLCALGSVALNNK